MQNFPEKNQMKGSISKSNIFKQRLGMQCHISPCVQEQTDLTLQNMTVAKSCNKTVLSLGQKGEHKSLSFIQKNKTKVPLDFKRWLTVSHSL